MLTAIEKSATNLFVIIAEIEVIWQAVFKSTRSLERSEHSALSKFDIHATRQYAWSGSVSTVSVEPFREREEIWR
jgi:hypothetical protein